MKHTLTCIDDSKQQYRHNPKQKHHFIGWLCLHCNSRCNNHDHFVGGFVVSFVAVELMP